MGNLNDPGVPCWNITPGHYIEGFGGPEFPSHKNDPHGSCNIFSDSCLSTKNYTPENVTWHWKIPVFNNNYTSSNGGISIVMLLFGGGNNPGDCWWDRGASLSKPPTNQSKKKMAKHQAHPKHPLKTQNASTEIKIPAVLGKWRVWWKACGGKCSSLHSVPGSHECSWSQTSWSPYPPMKLTPPWRWNLRYPKFWGGIISTGHD